MLQNLASESLLDRTVDGTYRVERLIGKGSMGSVYAARSLRTLGTFALKVLHRDAAGDDDLYARFRNEARLTSILRHPNIVQIFDFSQLPDGRPYLVMEFLEGEDLYTRLRRLRRLPVDEALRICREVGGALEAAHKVNVVHRDLKPGNIFLARYGQGDQAVEQAKVIDFGLSRIRGHLASAEQTLDMQILGTPQYMSPEAAQGLNSQLDGRSDQFSLAVILYLMLGGRSPFYHQDLAETLHHIIYRPHPPLRELRPEVPEHVAAAIDRALSKSKAARFPSLAEFLQALTAPAPMPVNGLPFDTIIDLGCRPEISIEALLPEESEEGTPVIEPETRDVKGEGAERGFLVLFLVLAICLLLGLAAGFGSVMLR